MKRFALPPSSRCTRKIVKWRRRRKKAGASTTTSFRGSTSVGRSAPPSVRQSTTATIRHTATVSAKGVRSGKRKDGSTPRRFLPPPLPVLFFRSSVGYRGETP